MVKPRALRPGDQIRVISPASPLNKEQTEQGVRLLEAEGYKVTFGDHAFDRDGYLAGDDKDRANDLHQAFSDPDVKCVMCSRGGYGISRLLPLLDIKMMAASRKMFCGFSDVTVLHLALNRLGLVTYHTPMILTFSVEREPWVIESFTNLLKGDASTPAHAKKGETLVGGCAKGVVTGGCLCLITDCIATKAELDAKGKILLIEDVDESPHRVDAMLTHLINTGIIQEASGIVVGEMTGTDDKIDPKIGTWDWRRIIENRIIPLQIPSVINFPFGHMKTMLSLPLGIEAELNADAGTLIYTESPCS